MDQHSLRDDTLSRTVKFAGECIGFGSNEEGPHTLRWTEVIIYKSDNDNFIVNKIGRTRVVHSIGSDCSATTTRVLDPYDDAHPCPKCQPDLVNDIAFLEEADRSSVIVSSSPEGLVESLYASDSNGTRFMIRTASKALAEASEKHSGIKEAASIYYA